MAGPDPREAAARLAAEIPAPVVGVLDRLRDGGHAAYLVGGSLRDALLRREPADWDLATDARPPEILGLFPGAVYENRFGTVAVRRDGAVFEITTFRLEHDYADHRRPHRVEFGDDLEADLARRDFTVNALAWGGPAIGDGGGRDAVLVDPFGGLRDLEAGTLRAVGDPLARLHEDALRMVRAVRLAATHDLAIEAATLAAIEANAGLVAHVSGERVGAELSRLLEAPRPSVGLRVAADTGLLAVIVPELAAQRGIAQNKVPGEDLWDHTLRSVDAAPAERRIVRLAALLHDVGKPATLADGRFHHHDVVGAEQAAAILRRLRFSKATVEDVAHLVRHHMFTVEADPSGTGRPPVHPPDRSRARRRAVRAAPGRRHRERPAAGRPGRRRRSVPGSTPSSRPRPPLDRGSLAVDGGDLIRDLGLEPGPRLGRVLDALLERVIGDPALNDRGTLMLLAQGMLADMPDDEVVA